MKIQPVSSIRPLEATAIASRTGETRRLAQPPTPQTNYQPPEVERLKSSNRAATLRAPETGKGTVVDLMG